jgi:hypothetical protein
MKIQGFPTEKEPDIQKKRKVYYKALDYFTKGINAVFKNIHIRIEFPYVDNNAQFLKNNEFTNAIGLIIQYMKFAPRLETPSSKIKLVPTTVNLTIKSFHVYCDYDIESYLFNDNNNGFKNNNKNNNNNNNSNSTNEAIIKKFNEETKQKHISLFLIKDMDIILTIEIKQKTGFLIPKITIQSSLQRFFCDFKQLQIFKTLIQLLVFSKKRIEQLTKLQKIFRNGFPLPKLYEINGVRFLPHLLYKKKLYPKETGFFIIFLKIIIIIIILLLI